MNNYSILTIIHATLATLAMLAGIVAILAQPKGNRIHKKSGRYYLYLYSMAVIVGLIMLFFKYKTFLFAFTLLNIYLLYMGYSFSQNKKKTITKLDWGIWGMLFITFILMIYDSLRMIDDLFTSDYGWSVVRICYVGFATYFLVIDYRFFRKQNMPKKLFIYQHAQKMLVSFIGLPTGIAFRYSDFFVSKDFRWIFWVIGYLVFIPLIGYWLKKYKGTYQISKV